MDWTQILHKMFSYVSVSTGTKNVGGKLSLHKHFKEKRPLISLRRPANLTDSLVRAKMKKEIDKWKAKCMEKCGKSSCQICCYVKQTNRFEYGNKMC